jgi:hypothetical protein
MIGLGMGSVQQKILYMKNIFLLTLLLTIFLFGITANGQTDIEKRPSIASGTRVIDLGTTPDSPEHLKELSISEVKGNNIQGSFYDSKFNNGLLYLNWDQVYFAFKTTENKNRFYHSGYFEGNEVFGFSYSPEREFVARRTGIRKEWNTHYFFVHLILYLCTSLLPPNHKFHL